jgi:uncharacterized protein YfaT (DUF1175 family)
LKAELGSIAHTRSGDKGDRANIAVLAWQDRHYAALLREVTAERVARHFSDWVRGPVTRYEVPNLAALNFVCEEALDGGGTISLRLDAQAKTFAARLLSLEIELTPEEALGLEDRP